MDTKTCYDTGSRNDEGGLCDNGRAKRLGELTGQTASSDTQQVSTPATTEGPNADKLKQQASEKVKATGEKAKETLEPFSLRALHFQISVERDAHGLLEFGITAFVQHTF